MSLTSGFWSFSTDDYHADLLMNPSAERLIVIDIGVCVLLALFTGP